MSGEHAVIVTNADQFKITDLDSKNFMMVNDVPIKKPRKLVHRDLIAISTTRLLFLLHGEAALPTGHIQLDDGQTTPQPKHSASTAGLTLPRACRINEG